jgi:hypothetical protein
MYACVFPNFQITLEKDVIKKQARADDENNPEEILDKEVTYFE